MRSMMKVMLLGIAAMAVACGGDAGGQDAGAPAQSDAAPSGSAAQKSAPQAPAPAPGSATLTIGGQHYEFDMTGVDGQCRDTGSATVGSFNIDAAGEPLAVDQPGVVLQLNFDIPVPEAAGASTPPRIFLVDGATGQMWLAGADPTEGVAAEHSVISGWTLIDGVARGSATFAELRGYEETPQGVEGTFEIACGG